MKKQYKMTIKKISSNETKSRILEMTESEAKDIESKIGIIDSKGYQLIYFLPIL